MAKEKESKQGRIDVVTKGDWNVVIPPELTIAGRALSHGAFRLWAILSYHARKPSDKRTCFPSVERISDMMGISRRNVQKYSRELQEKGLVSIERKRSPKGTVINIYTLNDVRAWWKKEGKKLKEKGLKP